jgi:hypothetical protein
LGWLLHFLQQYPRSSVAIQPLRLAQFVITGQLVQPHSNSFQCVDAIHQENVQTARMEKRWIEKSHKDTGLHQLLRAAVKIVSE